MVGLVAYILFWILATFFIFFLILCLFLLGLNGSPPWTHGSPQTPQPPSDPADSGRALDGARYFSVVWCKASKKKHKRWEGDAVLVVRGRSVVLKDMEGKDIGKGEP